MDRRAQRLPVVRAESNAADLVEAREALYGEAAKYNLYAMICIACGILMTVSLTLLFWVQEGAMVLWGLPVLLVSDGGSVALLKLKWGVQQEIERLHIALRKLTKSREGSAS